MTKEAEEKIRQLQLLEQSLQNLLMQKQTFQLQMMEVESALSELKNVKSAYKIVGNIMIASDSASLVKELAKKKETTELRIKSLETQERASREKASKLQEEILAEIKKAEK